MRYQKFAQFVVAGLLAAGVIGCQTKAGTGAAAGGIGGAALGAVIGHQSGHAGTGAVIGGLVGAGGGYIVGNEMDKADAKKERARSSYEPRDSRASATGYTVTRQDVINWTMRNTSDEVIINRIHQSGATFNLTAADEQELRDNGVSPRVIAAMKAAR